MAKKDEHPLPDREHNEGCPAERSEIFDAVRPATPDRPAQPVEVVRCIDCGGEQVNVKETDNA